MSRPRWDPLRDLLSLQERMNRLFEESLVRGRLADENPGTEWAPAADVLETPAAYHVELELPGLERDDIELRVEPRRLVVRGLRRLPWSAPPERFQRMERGYGPFQRSFTWAHDVDGELANAELHDGVLRLVLPKAGSRRVGVERG